MPRDQWCGLGLNLSDRDQPIDFLGVMESFQQALTITTPHRAAAMLEMLRTSGGRLRAVTRQSAWRGRNDAARAGIVLPSWGVLRAAHRTLEFCRKTHPPGELPDHSEGPGTG